MEFVEGIKYLLGASISTISDEFLEEVETLPEKTRQAAAQCRAFSMVRNTLFSTPMTETALAIRLEKILDWETVLDTYLGYISIDVEEPEGVSITEDSDSKYVVKHHSGNVMACLNKLIAVTHVTSLVKNSEQEISEDSKEKLEQLAESLDNARAQVSQQNFTKDSDTYAAAIANSALRKVNGELFIEDECAFHNDLVSLSVYLCEQFLKETFFLGSDKVLNLIKVNFLASASDLSLYKYYHSHAKRESFVCQVYVPRHEKFFKYMRTWRQKFFSNDRVFINFMNMGVSEYKAAVVTFLEFDKLRGLISEDGTPLVAPSPAKQPTNTGSVKSSRKKIATAEETPKDEVESDKIAEITKDLKEDKSAVEQLPQEGEQLLLDDAVAQGDLIQKESVEVLATVEDVVAQGELSKEELTPESRMEESVQVTANEEPSEAKESRTVEPAPQTPSKNFIPKSKQKKLERQRLKEEQRRASKEAAAKKAREEQEAHDNFIREQARQEAAWLIEQAKAAELKAKEEREALLKEKEECAARIAAYEQELAQIRQNSGNYQASIDNPEGETTSEVDILGDIPGDLQRETTLDSSVEAQHDEQKVSAITESEVLDEGIPNKEVSKDSVKPTEPVETAEPVLERQVITERIDRPAPVYSSRSNRSTPTAFEIALRAAQEAQAAKANCGSSDDLTKETPVPNIASATTTCWKYSDCQVSGSVPDAWNRIDAAMATSQFSSGCVLIDGDNVNPVFLYTFLRNCFRTPNTTKIHIIFDSEPLFRWDVWSGNRVTYEVAPHVNIHKNAGDIMLSYRLSKLVLEGAYDKFILVSSDSDYSCLCEELSDKLIIVSEQEKFSSRYAAYLQEKNIPFLYMSDFITAEEVRKLLGDKSNSPDYNFITNMLMAGRVFAR